MIALLELDVTDALAAIARMQAADTRVSLFDDVDVNVPAASWCATCSRSP